MTPTDPCQLVVRNHSVGTAVITCCTGFLLALMGLVLLPMTHVIVPPSGGEVAMSGTGTVLVLVGLTIAALGVRMRRSQTVLALVGEELTVTVRTGSESSRQHVLRVEDIEDVGIETGNDSG